MADLTPPPSQNNTPLRPSEDPAADPPSPTTRRAPHPLATAGTMDLDSAALTSTSASASASRSPATPSPEPEMNNSIFNDVPPASSGIAADDEEDGMDDTEEEETVLVDEREVTGKGKGKREPEVRASGKKMPRSNAKGRKEGKESDLYESDIVARWNREFGDVCAVPKSG